MPRFGIFTRGNRIGSIYLAGLKKLFALGGFRCELWLDAEMDLPRRHFGHRVFAVPAVTADSVISVPRVSCRLIQGNGVYRLDEAGACIISDKRLDFVLDCSEIPVNWSAGIALHGVWRLRYGAAVLGDPPGIVELQRGERTIRIVLERLDDGRILADAIVPLDRESYANTLAALSDGSADLPVQVCTRFAITGNLPALNIPLPVPAPPITGARMAACAASMAARWAASQIRLTFVTEMWNVGVVDAPIESFLAPGYTPAVEWLPRLRGERFIADPFGVADREKLTLFVEEFDYDRENGGQGYISTVENKSGAPRVIIDEHVHMSYPYPVEYTGQHYCIPECHKRGSVVLYRYEDGRWLRDRTLLNDIAALDSTVFEYAGRWWLFCTLAGDMPDAKLYVWHADHLFGPWQPHLLNPVKCDVRSSRPGGTPFEYDGALYRPAQDSSISYGGALTINRITALSETEFDEEPIAHIRPQRPYRDGVHTLSAAGSKTILDGKVMEFRARLAARRFVYKIRHLTHVVSGR